MSSLLICLNVGTGFALHFLHIAMLRSPDPLALSECSACPTHSRVVHSIHCDDLSCLCFHDLLFIWPFQYFSIIKLSLNFMAPFFKDGVQLPQGCSHFEEVVYFLVPRNSWYSFYRPRKDEMLSRPWSHPVVLNTGPLDWESSALTTRPLLHETKDNRLRILPWGCTTTQLNYYVTLRNCTTTVHFRWC